MQVTISYGTDRHEVALVRVLDLDQRRLHVAIPWDEHPAVTLATIRDRLTPEEEVELRAALGLDLPDGAA
jgi:hypothetical protein